MNGWTNGKTNGLLNKLDELMNVQIKTNKLMNS